MIVTNDATSNCQSPPLLSYRVIAPLSGEELSSGSFEAEFIFQDFGKSIWRFNMSFRLHPELELQVLYTVNGDAALGDFFLPAQSQSMNVVFFSCNGFSLGVEPDDFKGDLWKDVLRHHNVKHYHVMLGGGDQIYNDMVTVDCEPVHKWTQIKLPHHKHHHPFPEEEQRITEEFYMNHYIAWFGNGYWKGPKGHCLKPDFPKAMATIPSINIYDDHDIIDGFGSYHDSTMNSPYFSGIGKIAFKYYMLFQHQTHPKEDPRRDSSWISNIAKPGPYIHEPSRSIYARLGLSMAFLGMDCRTERTLHQIVYPETYQLMFDRVRKEVKADNRIKHLLVMMGVPVAYPRLVWLESLLTSKVMSPIKFIAKKKGAGLLNNFDDAIEILDDLNDHWCAKTHKAERNQMIYDLQQLARDTGVRLTLLAGDVHLAAIGRFYSKDKELQARPELDPRLMLNVVSSAITNTAPPDKMADFLNSRNKIHHLGDETNEDMVRIFNYDVDGTSRNNKCLLPRRNWCSIQEILPGNYPTGYKRNDHDTFTSVASGPRFPESNETPGTFENDDEEVKYPDGPGSLSIVLHVEKDRSDATGETRPYETVVPLLKM